MSLLGWLRVGSLCAAAQIDSTVQEPALPAADERPRLVVVLVVDQMIPEQLTRLQAHWRGGFARLLAGGRRFENAAFEYATTETCPGHATIATGTYPAQHGIVGNDWLAADSKEDVYCVADASVKPLRSGGLELSDGRSPRAILRPGLSDRLKAADPRSKALTLSLKDRSAIGLGGQHPDLALWLDLSGGGVMSSTWYASALPDWVVQWNRGWALRAKQSAVWPQWKSSLPEDLGGTATASDDREGEADFLDERHEFPFDGPKLGDPPSELDLQRLARWAYRTPLGDELLFDLALSALDALELGRDPQVDFLGLSLSNCDILGHACGPTSREVTDLLLRDDLLLGRFFDRLDETVGAGRWTAVLTADHGVLELPEALREQGIAAERVSSKRLGEAVKAVRRRLEARFGESLVVDHDAVGLRLSAERMRARGLEPRAVREEARQAFLSEAPWCERCFLWDELLEAQPGQTSDAALALQARGFDRERTGDLVWQAKPFHLVGVGIGTSHASPHPYDRRVPLVFYGPGFAPGTSAAAASPVDILPTLLASLGLEPAPDLDGRALPVR